MSLHSLRIRARRSQLALNVWLAIMSASLFYPIFFMLNLSVKSDAQALGGALRITWPPHFENYTSAWHSIGGFMSNTAIVTAVSLVGTLVFASITAYVFARYEFPGREILFYAFIILMMIPGVLTLVPRFVLVAMTMDLVNSLWGVILPLTATGQAFNIFILRSFFASLPNELFESARLDGANHLHLWRHIVLPMSQPILATVAVLHILSAWNEFIWSNMILIGQNVRTIAIGLYYLQGVGTEYEQLATPGRHMAGYAIAAIPLLIVFLISMRSFVSGLTSGAIKM